MRTELPVISFISCILVLIPLPWHLRARNVATLTIITALFLTNLVHGINSIIWAGSVVTKYPVWCDITTKLSIGVQVALPAASLCITKHLEAVASIRSTMTTADDKRRRTIFEFCLCAVMPCVFMALHYIVQGHRFDIAEDFGCMPTTYHSWPAFIVVYLPPLVLSFISLCCAGLAFRWFVIRRAQFAEHLRSCNSGLTTGRYMRLMAMALGEIVIGTGLGGYILGVTLRDSHWRHYDNWAVVHSNFSRIAQFPRVLVPGFYWTRLLISWYIAPIGSLNFFIFFGFGQEAMAEYSRVWQLFRTRVLRLAPNPSNASVLPTFSAPPRNASSSRVVRLHLDNLSIDEKWDEGEMVDACSSAASSGPDESSRRHSNSASPITRPMSVPPHPSSPTLQASARAVSLDVPRGNE